jgi:O-antigen/teichoic acid export membrane protein
MAALIQAVIMLLLVRAIDPSRFGAFAAVYGVITVVQTASDFGLPVFIVRERARDATSSVVTQALRLSNRLSAGLAVLIASTGVALTMWVSGDFAYLIPLALWAAAERNADAWLGVPLADGDARINSINLLARRAGHLLTFVVLLAVSDIAPTLAFAITAALAASLSWVFVHRRVVTRLPRVERVMDARGLLRSARPYWINSLATQAKNFDAVLVSGVAGTGAGGLYAAAARLTTPLRILPTSLAAVLMPMASKRDSRTLMPLVKLVMAAVVGAVLFYGLLALIMPIAVPRALGSGYAGAVVPLQIATASLIFASIASLFGALLQGVGRNRYVAWTAVLTTSVCLVGVGIGSLMGGAVGAAIGLAASFIVQAGALVGRTMRFIAKREK